VSHKKAYVNMALQTIDKPLIYKYNPY